ncbi:S8 family serine peptidase [Bradyrhizobium niftali]|jgi:serine protease|uniref:Peptidase S8/S53 domain-containing protein n=1 Tax=Bradyrhizobium niftali TaxID=2560055 RepID=A0A4Y9LFG8_9BRAD|nr:S8 family serine peptidase [Bradyrhizobium niftali]TFV41397.1 hypothetical protein E4K65_36570 [Bradyrhizobium niftali]
MAAEGTSVSISETVLREIARQAHGTVDGLPMHIIRFVLEFPSAQDLAEAGVQLRSILGSGKFDLRPLDDQLPKFFVLQFPGVPRTIAPPRLFAAADFLCDKLSLVSCVPDIGSTLYAEPDARLLRDGAPESAITNAFCWSDAAAPEDMHWAPNAIKADLAWTLENGKGDGILVAQPDTGIATHPELELGMFDLERAANVLEGGSDPKDPLRAGTANPGHGTATSSVVASRVQGKIVGAAPLAKVIPIRCIEDVKIFDGAPVARAILHAVSVNADIISMSLGGIYSPSIAAALEKAVAAGCIVVVASGNCVGFVVYPASDRNSIALAGVNAGDVPWKGTSRGSAVDVSAPAENVFVARRTPEDNETGVVAGGQGTSFATALTAGAAAIWLSHFGRDRVRAEAKRRNVHVQELFRAALRRTARKPAGWNGNLYGAGIVDAQSLLQLPLAEIPSPSATAEAAASTGLSEEDRDTATVFELAASRAKLEGFDWARYGAEASFLAADERRRSDPTKAGLVESRIRPKPTSGLSASAPPVLQRVLTRLEYAPELIAPLDRQPEAKSTFRTLLSRPRIVRPGVSAESPLRGRSAQEIQDRLNRAIKKMDDRPDATPESKSRRRDLFDRSEKLLKKAEGSGGGHNLIWTERADIEALVRLTGRPALKVTDGKIDPAALAATEWEDTFKVDPKGLQTLFERVGRVDLDGEHVGTGFVVGEGLIMTNRHVAEAIADEIRGRGPSTWIVQDNASINFDDRGLGSAKKFRIKSLVFAGSETIGREVNFGHLDMALFEVETSNGSSSFPTKMSQVGDRDVGESKVELIVVGYPARPDISALEDPETHQVRDDIAKRLGEIFGLDYGRKYLAPGRIEDVAGSLGDDQSHRWVFSHDSTTLAGCSGSCVSQLIDFFPILGLHFAGRNLTANYAHSLAAVRASGQVPAAILERLGWTA